MKSKSQGRGAPETPQTTQALILIAHHNQIVKLLQHTLIARHGEIKLDLTWKLDLFWLAFRMSNGAMYLQRESLMNLPSSRLCMLQY